MKLSQLSAILVSLLAVSLVGCDESESPVTLAPPPPDDGWDERRHRMDVIVIGTESGNR